MEYVKGDVITWLDDPKYISAKDGDYIFVGESAGDALYNANHNIFKCKLNKVDSSAANRFFIKNSMENFPCIVLEKVNYNNYLPYDFEEKERSNIGKAYDEIMKLRDFTYNNYKDASMVAAYNNALSIISDFCESDIN